MFSSICSHIVLNLSSGKCCVSFINEFFHVSVWYNLVMLLMYLIIIQMYLVLIVQIEIDNLTVIARNPMMGYNANSDVIIIDNWYWRKLYKTLFFLWGCVNDDSVKKLKLFLQSIANICIVRSISAAVNYAFHKYVIYGMRTRRQSNDERKFDMQWEPLVMFPLNFSAYVCSFIDSIYDLHRIILLLLYTPNCRDVIFMLHLSMVTKITRFLPSHNFRNAFRVKTIFNHKSIKIFAWYFSSWLQIIWDGSALSFETTTFFSFFAKFLNTCAINYVPNFCYKK